jgi:hypothetical protein
MSPKGRPSSQFGWAPEARLVACGQPALKESVDSWPLAITISTHSGARPYTGNRLSLDVTGNG